MRTRTITTEATIWLSWPGEYLLEGTEVEASGSGGDVAVWRIDAGALDGVDVSGQVVVAVSGSGGDAGAILLDEELALEQTLALFDAFRGRVGENPGFSQVPIEHQVASGRVAVSVPGRLSLVADTGASPTAEVWVHLPEHGLAWQGESCPVSCREFHWSSRPCRAHAGQRRTPH